MPICLLMSAIIIIFIMAQRQSKLTSFFPCDPLALRVNKQLVQVNSYYNCHYLRLIQPILYFLDDEEQAQSLSDNEAEVVSEFQCECPCCTMGDVCQPLGVEGSKITYSHSSQQPNMKRTYCRSIQTSWYQKYSWITVCTSSYKIFCNPCRQAKDKGLLSYSKRRAN